MICILTAFHGRPYITEIYLRGIQRLYEDWNEDFFVLGVASDRENVELLKDRGISYLMADNHPVGEKHNKGLRAALETEFDKLVQLGSDDLLDHNYDLESGTAPTKAYQTDGNKTVLVEYDQMIGAGRCLSLDDALKGSHRVICYANKSFVSQGTYNKGIHYLPVEDFGRNRDKLEEITSFHRMWPDEAEDGLDNASELELIKGGVYLKPREEAPVVDIKTGDNLTKMMSGENTVLPKWLSDDEKEMIAKL